MNVYCYFYQEKNEQLSGFNNISEQKIDRTSLGQLMFYLACHAMQNATTSVVFDELGIYTEAFKVCAVFKMFHNS